MYKIGPNKFMGGGGVCGRGEKGGAFCSVCIFHNQKMHVYLIFIIPFKVKHVKLSIASPVANLIRHFTLVSYNSRFVIICKLNKKF